MGKLQFFVLGPLRIEHDCRPLSEPTARKARALLAYLAVSHREHSRQTLAGLLWSDVPETLALASLRKALLQVRSTVGEHVTADRNTIALDPLRPHSVDAHVFEQACRRLRTEAWPAGSIPEALQEAIAVYRGDFLADFPETDAPLFEEWATQQREYYRNLALNALQRLADDALERDDVASGLDHARRLLELDPLQEDGHRTLMRLHARSGNRAAALQQYDACVRILQTELDVPPSENTVALAESIRDGTWTCRASSEPAFAVEVARPVRHNLPAALTPLIGRRAELVTLDEMLASNQVRHISILGEGGMGKTRLALAMAHRHAEKDQFAHGIYFADLATVDGPAQFASAVAEALHLPLQVSADDKRTPGEQLIDYVRTKEMLLILDNCEGLQEGLGLIRDVLRQAPLLKIVTTSRERLRLPGERVFRVDGLERGGAPPVQGDSLPSALRLFIQTAQRIVPAFEPRDEELSDIWRICNAVDGMPLAIELAASWVEVLSPYDIAQELDKGLGALESRWQGVPARHRSMRAVFDTTWRQLTESERRTFAALSVFVGGFTRLAAERVSGASVSELSELAAKSLIHFDRVQNRYVIHELLRQYAKERLAERAGEEKRIHDRHCLHFCGIAEVRGAELLGRGQSAALAALEGEAENLREAWLWACRHGEWELLERAIDGVGFFCEWRGRVGDGETVFQSAIEALQTQRGAAPPALLAHSFTWLSEFQYGQGRTFEADESLSTAMALLDQNAADDAQMIQQRAYAWLRNGIQAHYRDDDKAHCSFAKSHDLYERIGHKWGIARSLSGLAQAEADLGHYSASEERFRKALVLLRDLGDRRIEAHSLHRLAIMLRNAGQLQEAVSLAKESHQLNQELGDRAGTAWSGQILAECLSSSGAQAEAEELLTKSESLAADLGDSLRLENLYQEHAIVLMRQGRYQEAYGKAEKGLGLARGRAHHLRVAWCQIILSRLDLQSGNNETAEARLREAETILSKSSRPHELAVLYAHQAMAVLGQQDVSTSRRLIVDSLSLSARHHDVRVLLGLTALTQLLARIGRAEEAVAVYGYLKSWSAATSDSSDPLIRKDIDRLTEQMSPNEIDEALSRYVHLDVWDLVAYWIDEVKAME